MNRFHLHIAVRDLAANIDFYSKLFNEPPSKQAQDYAKWMLDDPPVNFAISQRGHTPGINHVGIEAGTPESLVPLRRQADLASQGDTIPQGDAACCYAKSEKHWTIDPQGALLYAY